MECIVCVCVSVRARARVCALIMNDILQYGGCSLKMV